MYGLAPGPGYRCCFVVQGLEVQGKERFHAWNCFIWGLEFVLVGKRMLLNQDLLNCPPISTPISTLTNPTSFFYLLYTSWAYTSNSGIYYPQYFP